MTAAGSQAPPESPSPPARLPQNQAGNGAAGGGADGLGVDDLMRGARWAQAAEALVRGGQQDLGSLLKLRLARNMAAMQVLRPVVYNALTGEPGRGQYRLMPAQDGQLTIAFVQPGKPACCLSDQAQPSKGLARLTALARNPANQYHVLALQGVGDGYFLGWLAANMEPDALGMTLPTYVIEPEPEVIYQAMMIHDWTGPRGPIAQERFIWAVGAGWEGALQRAIDEEPQLRHPSLQISQSIVGEQIAARLNAMLAKDKARQDAIRRRVRGLYDGHDREHLLMLLGERPPRRPRILCLTSRFSTVVQYVAMDMAQAMERQGWETRVLTDKAPHLVVGVSAVLRAMEEFRPDVAFTVNHPRAETGLGDGFPPKMPYVCWIQDHTRVLTNKATGATIGLRDYVLVESPRQYVERFDYPARQCIAMPKLTAAVEVGPRQEAEGEDLVYVSHASGTPQELYDKLCAPVQGRSPEYQALLGRCGQRLLDLYAAGGSCPSSDLMHELIRQVVRDHAMPDLDDAYRDVVCQALYVPLNNALYRQQTLGWIADIAARMKLRLGIYGGGWGKHPRLGRFAKGKIAFGADLQALTRRSRINFQIVPYAFFHQRLFEGLMAGGFFLIRSNPHDSVQAEYFRGEGIIQGDLPDLEAVCFEDQAGLARLIERFVHNPELREQIMSRQRAFVMEHFTYDKGARRLVEMMRQRIDAEAG